MFKVGTLVIDAAISESHSTSVEVTEYPTELGANLADHARKKPFVLSIEGIVSDTPLNIALQQIRENETEGKSPSLWAYGKLEELAASSQVVDITTSLRTYSNMKITSITVTRDGATARALSFSLSATQIEIVSVDRARLASKKQNKGYKGPTAAQVNAQRDTMYAMKVGFFTSYVYADGTPVDPKDVPRLPPPTAVAFDPASSAKSPKIETTPQGIDKWRPFWDTGKR